MILHAHPPGDTCSACESTSIKAELPETLQWGILSGQEQKEFLEKAEAERIREFYNFDKYCWGPGMCKAAQEQVISSTKGSTDNHRYVQIGPGFSKIFDNWFYIYKRDMTISRMIGA